MTYQTIKLEYFDEVALLKFTRISVMNSLSIEMVKEVLDAFTAIRENSAIGALVISGEGKAFCTGAELNPEFFMGIDGKSPAESLDYHMQYILTNGLNSLKTSLFP